MKNIAYGAALAAFAALIPAGASAQRLSPAVVAVVNTDRISRECTACVAANSQLQTQVNALRTRAQQVQQQAQTEGQPLQQALAALAGKPADAALQARITAFETKQRSAQEELARSEQNLRSTQAHVQQQIGQRLGPIVNTVAQARGATLAVDQGSTLFAAPSLDITTEVLTQLNQQLPSVSVTPLPQQQAPAAPAQQQPQGR